MIILFDISLQHLQTKFCGGVFQGRNERSRIRSTPFFLFFILNFITPAWATTFGEISLVNQAQEAPLILHGRIGASHVAMEPFSQRPHTYWQLQVFETVRGKSVGESVLLRSPGGELNGIGYHVAASASFRQGEEVIVMAQDTRESPSTKEVFGLLSGKYTVDLGADGQKAIRSGFGTWVEWPEGKTLSLAEYKDLVYQIGNRPPTEREKNIRLHPTPHDHEDFPAKITEQNHPQTPVKKSNTSEAENTPQKSESLQSTEQNSDRSLGGRSSAFLLGLGLLLLLLAGIFYWRRKR